MNNTTHLPAYDELAGYLLDGNTYCVTCGEDGDGALYGAPLYAIDATSDLVCDSCHHFIEEPERVAVGERAKTGLACDYIVEVHHADNVWHVTEYHETTGYPMYHATYRTKQWAIKDANSRLAEEEALAGIQHARFSA